MLLRPRRPRGNRKKEYVREEGELLNLREGEYVDLVRRGLHRDAQLLPAFPTRALEQVACKVLGMKTLHHYDDCP